jgi:16S rRNA (cytosine1402-N4)-methyltransferase
MRARCLNSAFDGPPTKVQGVPIHEPVLTSEVLRYLAPSRAGVIVDCTIGLGGHTKALLEAGATRVLGLDRDADALTAARQALAAYADRVELVHADYRRLPEVLEARGIERIDGALADLGVSSMQLDAEGRGFSFRRDDPLDMRMDRSTGLPASELVNSAPETELADVIWRYGEERFSRRIARRIAEERERAPIVTTAALADIVRRAIPTRGYQRIDPATRTFQALRIWVNAELEGLDTFLQAVVTRLREGARLVVISFHSLEDRIVKHTLRALATGGNALVTVLTKRPVMAQEDELERNARARSAKLRAAERLPAAA